MNYPVDRPIRNHYEATLAAQSAYWWPVHTVEAIHPIGDRLIEIVIFRAEKLWRDTHSAGPSTLSIEPAFITVLHDPMLLAPAGRPVNFAPGTIVANCNAVDGSGFFGEASCLNLLGSMQMAELFRRTMGARFGLPLGTSELNHSSSPWPTLPLWQGPRAMLDLLMTHDHRIRREAGLLELDTDAAPHAPGQRRL
jgi:hypothetical protein